MTREEAKAILENDIVGGHVEGNARFMDAFWMAVDALSQDPTETSTDAEHRVEQLPSVTQKSGEWLTDEIIHDGCKYTVTYCSECDEQADYRTPFCPNCGAKMVEPQESEDKE